MSVQLLVGGAALYYFPISNLFTHSACRVPTTVLYRLADRNVTHSRLAERVKAFARALLRYIFTVPGNGETGSHMRSMTMRYNQPQIS